MLAVVISVVATETKATKVTFLLGSPLRTSDPQTESVGVSSFSKSHEGEKLGVGAGFGEGGGGWRLRGHSRERGPSPCWRGPEAEPRHSLAAMWPRECGVSSLSGTKGDPKPELQPFAAALAQPDACFKFWAVPAGCMGPGCGSGLCWVHRSQRVISAIPLASHRTHVKPEKRAFSAPCQNLQRRAPRQGGKGGAGAVGVEETAPSRQRASTQVEAPGAGPLTPPLPLPPDPGSSRTLALQPWHMGSLGMESPRLHASGLLPIPGPHTRYWNGLFSCLPGPQSPHL